MERHFERELEELKLNLIQMGKVVDDQIDMAYRALFEGNEGLALQVIAKDQEVDAFDTLIDTQCQRIFALSQPVAADLRLLMAALNINTQIERIGDIAANVAERVPPLVAYKAFLQQTRISDMAEIARVMVRDSLESFIRSSPGLATRVLESDDVVDTLDRQNFAHLVKAMKSDNALVEPAAHMLILSRHIERLADHATNIAEDVIFVVQARLVKHNAAAEG